MKEHDWLWSTALVVIGVVCLLFDFHRQLDQNVAVNMFISGVLVGVGSQQLRCLFLERKRKKEEHR